MITLRPYQSIAVQEGLTRLQTLGIVYLCMEVRTGKTLVSLEIARVFGAKRVLFLTKKKAIDSIRKDFAALAPDYEITVINDESLHTVEGDFDLLIRDEHHRSGAFPKPGLVTKTIKKRFSKLPMIFLSGTPMPEGWSQIYHQFWVSARSPFIQKSFYQWCAAGFVTVKQRMIRERWLNDYSGANIDVIAPIIEPYLVRTTQASAGFQSVITEEFITVKQSSMMRSIIARLKQDLVVQGKEQSITAATSVSLMQKLHQLAGGTIKFDPIDGKSLSKTLDYSKVDLIVDRFADQQIVIFYQYCQELEALKERLGDRITTDLAEFSATSKSIALQIVSGREGINLSKASAIVFYNLSFSATSYWQARDRMTTIDRAESKVYWLFSENGIEEKIYAAVSRKKDYTIRAFKKEFGVKNSKLDRQSTAA
jgi:hypothetical protein